MYNSLSTAGPSDEIEQQYFRSQPTAGSNQCGMVEHACEYIPYFSCRNITWIIMKKQNDMQVFIKQSAQHKMCFWGWLSKSVF